MSDSLLNATTLHSTNPLHHGMVSAWFSTSTLGLSPQIGAAHSSSGHGSPSKDSTHQASNSMFPPSPGEAHRKMEVYEWGRGQQILEKPRLLMGRKIKEISCGGSHAAALLDSGEIYCWGEGRNGQLGLGTEIKRAEDPTLLPLSLFSDKPISRLWCGYVQTAAFTVDSQLFIWGYDPFLGPVFSPVLYPEFSNVQVTSIAFGPTMTMILVNRESHCRRSWGKKLSDLKVWGRSSKGTLGLGPVTEQKEPLSISTLSPKGIVQVSVGEKHVACCSARGEVYAWGFQTDISWLGTGKPGLVSTPTKCLGLEGQYIIKVVCGSESTYALSADGEIFSWGFGRHGVLGHGDEADQFFPKKIEAISGVKGISSGGMHCVAWKDDGTIYSWGYGRKYKLGHGSTEEDKLIPTLVQAMTKGKIVIQVACGFDRTIAFLEKDIINIRFKDFPPQIILVRTDYTVNDILQKAASFYRLDENKMVLIDEAGSELSNGTIVRRLQADGKNIFYLVPRISLLEQESDDLVFVKSEEQITNDNYGEKTFPSVKGGTVSRLIDWLTFHKPTGQSFRNGFLLMYRNWMTPEQLLEKLIDRYNHPSIPPMELPLGIDLVCLESFSVVKLSVLQVLVEWLTRFPLDFTSEGLESIRLVEELWIFIEGSATVDFPKQASVVRRVLLKIIEKAESESTIDFPIGTYPLIKEELCPPPIPATHTRPIDLFKYVPEEVARHICIIDYYDFFLRIEAKEFFGLSWNKPDRKQFATNILQAIRRFNNLSEWVVAEILRSESRENRINKARTFIEIAYFCKKLNGFNSVMTIISAFNQTPIHRLKHLWDTKNGIGERHLDMLGELRELMSNDNNSKCYRDHYTNCPSPKIPFLGVTLQDITFSTDGNPDLLDEKKQIIHFQKWQKIGQMISLVLDIATKKYHFKPIPQLVKYLLNARGFDNHAQTAYEYSKMIEPKEGGFNDRVSTVHLQLQPLPSNLSSIALYDSPSVTLEAPEIQLLDRRVCVILGQHDSMEDERRKLWTAWVEKLGSSSTINVSHKSFQKLSLTNLFTGRFRSYSPEDIKGAIADSMSLQKKDSSQKMKFKDILIASRAIEVTTMSCILQFPIQEDSYLLKKIFSKCLTEEINVEDLVEVLHELSQFQLPRAERETISNIVGSYKLIGFSHRNKLIAKSKERIKSLMSNLRQLSTLEPTPFLFFESIFVSGEIVSNLYSVKQLHFQNAKDLSKALSVLDDPSVDALCNFLRDLRQGSEKVLAQLSEEKNEVTQRLDAESEEIDKAIQEESYISEQLNQEEKRIATTIKELEHSIMMSQQKIYSLEYIKSSELSKLDEKLLGLAECIEMEQQLPSFSSLDLSKSAEKIENLLDFVDESFGSSISEMERKKQMLLSTEEKLIVDQVDFQRILFGQSKESGKPQGKEKRRKSVQPKKEHLKRDLPRMNVTEVDPLIMLAESVSLLVHDRNHPEDHRERARELLNQIATTCKQMKINPVF